ncbi:hypothetical protein AB0O01_06165 [Streptomyces sp. NPDC093252]|uniref:hypothetical protein n=1 Tax=Streptomyces sp. NPDC093252 TaxID=3154980 RepID=UPI0034371F80
MPRTDEYRDSRKGAARLMAEAHKNAPKSRRGDSRSMILIHVTLKDGKKRKLIERSTPIRRSGLTATADSHYSRPGTAPEHNEAKKDSEKASADDALRDIRALIGKVQPYRIAIDLVTSRRPCNSCADTAQELTDDVARYFPAAEVKTAVLSYDREKGSVHEEFAVVPGRFKDHVARSGYGNASAVPMHHSAPAETDQGYDADTHTSHSDGDSDSVGAGAYQTGAYQVGESHAESSSAAQAPAPAQAQAPAGEELGADRYWKLSLYPDEPLRYQGPVQEPVRGGGVLESTTDDSPYVTTEPTHSTASDSDGSGQFKGKASDSSGSYESALSAQMNEALNPANWLPEQGLPNTHLNDGMEYDSQNALHYTPDFSRIVTSDGQRHDFVGAVPDPLDRTVFAYGNSRTGMLGLYTFDATENQWATYPTTKAKDYCQSYLTKTDPDRKKTSHHDRQKHHSGKNSKRK